METRIRESNNNAKSFQERLGTIFRLKDSFQDDTLASLALYLEKMYQF